MKRLLWLLVAIVCTNVCVAEVDTEIMYLSGKDGDSPKEWSFRCSSGQNSGKWSKIAVPSCWEQQGYGDYTYGRFYLDKDAKPSDETGEYKYNFMVPASWKGKTVEIVFEGVMTDALVKINGKNVRPVHQGAFASFSYDVSKLLSYGKENLLEVFVSKESGNESINRAERRADWWLFGGIYRPVYLKVMPKTHIDYAAINAHSDGTLNVKIETSNAPKDASLVVSIDGKQLQSQKISDATNQTLSFKFENIEPWDPEHPNLYTLTMSLVDSKGVTLHRQTEKVGFRTLEFIPKDGFYLNGTKLLVKGINRHCFYPETGRTTSKARDIQDIKLIKGMNANAIRSHYPPDRHFLELCDSLGVLYFDELPGWQDPYDDEVGPKILKEMVRHDANHPCVFAWGNGNEGGFNYNLVSLFDEFDPQGRKVVHPWTLRGGVDAHHYPAYQTGVARLGNGYEVFMPTEFLHAKYDKGGGASLQDFWHNWSMNPAFAGGFIWAYVDEGVMRSDQNWEIDTNGGNGPDGIVGPHREKEASWYAIRDVWSPLQIEPITLRWGRLPVLSVANKSLYSSTSEYSMKYEVVDAKLNGGEKILASGNVDMRDAMPGETVKLTIGNPVDYERGTFMRLTAFQGNDTVNVWTFPLLHADEYKLENLSKEKALSNEKPRVQVTDDSCLSLQANGVKVAFDMKTGLISKVMNGGKEIPFNNGPVPVGMKMNLIDIRQDGDHIVARYDGAVDSVVWSMSGDGKLSMDAVLLNRKKGGNFDGKFVDDEVRNLGFSFSYPEEMCDGMTWIGRGPYRVWRNRQNGQNFGLWHKDYNNTVTGQPKNGKLEYPEFKGYHANVYEARIESSVAPFSVSTATDGLYLRMFTPEEPSSEINTQRTMEDFPSGDISFLLEIAPISSYKPLSQLGPKAVAPNVRINKGDEGIRMNLTFDFAGY